mgnify:CR=1 FL=1
MSPTVSLWGVQANPEPCNRKSNSNPHILRLLPGAAPLHTLNASEPSLDNNLYVCPAGGAAASPQHPPLRVPPSPLVLLHPPKPPRQTHHPLFPLW